MPVITEFDAPTGVIESRARAIGGSNRPLNLLVFGDPGVGKTQFAGTSAAVKAMSPAMLINVEGGESVFDDPAAIGLTPDTIPKNWPINGDLGEFEKAYWYLRQSNQEKFKTVIIDTGGELQQLHIDTKVAQGVGIGKRADQFDRQLKDYGVNKDYMLFWMRRFRDLDMNFILICHSELDTKADSQDEIHPLVTRKLVKPLCALFDVVAYMFAVSVPAQPFDRNNPVYNLERRMLFETVNIDGVKIHAKDRTSGGKLGKTMADPKMSKVWSRYTKVSAKVESATSTRKPAPQGEPNAQTE